MEDGGKRQLGYRFQGSTEASADSGGKGILHLINRINGKGKKGALDRAQYIVAE